MLKTEIFAIGGDGGGSFFCNSEWSGLPLNKGDYSFSQQRENHELLLKRYQTHHLESFLFLTVLPNIPLIIPPKIWDGLDIWIFYLPYRNLPDVP